MRLCVTSMGLKPEEEDLRVLWFSLEGERKRGEVTTAPDLEVPLSGKRLMAASNR